MRKYLISLFLVVGVLSMTSCTVKGSKTRKNSAPNDGVQILIQETVVPEGTTVTDLTKEIIDTTLVTGPASANVAESLKPEVTVGQLNPDALTQAGEHTLEVEVKVPIVKNRNVSESTSSNIEKKTIKTSVKIVVVTPETYHKPELVGEIEDVEPSLNMTISKANYEKNLKVSYNGEEKPLSDFGHKLYDGLVDYSTPGTYAVRITLSKGGYKDREYYVPVKIKMSQVMSKVDMLKVFEIDHGEALRCKSDASVTGNVLYVPSLYQSLWDDKKQFDVTKLEWSACLNNPIFANIEYIVVDKGVKIIEGKAFAIDNGQVTSTVQRIYLPEGLQTIADDAFANQNNVYDLLLPVSVKNGAPLQVSKHALRDMDNIKEIYIKEMPTLLGMSANEDFTKSWNGVKWVYGSTNFHLFSGLETDSVQVYIPYQYKFGVSENISATANKNYQDYINLLYQAHSYDHLNYYSKIARTPLGRVVA